MVRLIAHNGPLNIADEMAKSTTRNILILSLSRHIFRTVIEKSKDEIWKAYPSGKPYLSFPETKEGRRDLNTFTRRRAGVDRWEAAKRLSILLIKI